MNYSSEKNKKAMMSENGAIAVSVVDESADRRLRELLRKAVKKEKAPENLRDRIRRSIRE